MKSKKEYDELIKQSAYRVAKVLTVFKDESPDIKRQARRAVMNHALYILGEMSDSLIIEGPELVTEVKEPGQTGPINTSTDQGEEDPAVWLQRLRRTAWRNSQRTCRCWGGRGSYCAHWRTRVCCRTEAESGRLVHPSPRSAEKGRKYVLIHHRVI